MANKTTNNTTVTNLYNLYYSIYLPSLVFRIVFLRYREPYLVHSDPPNSTKLSYKAFASFSLSLHVSCVTCYEFLGLRVFYTAFGIFKYSACLLGRCYASCHTYYVFIDNHCLKDPFV